MAQTINTNVASLNAQRNLNASQGSLATSLQRLSSGLRINSAKDDAAGLAISERFNSQIRGINQAVRNANDGISLAQTAEGALTEVGSNLQRIRELAVQSSNATNSKSDREALNAEVKQLVAEIDRVAKQSEFNGTKLLDGSFSGQLFQVGANAGETIAIQSTTDARADKIGGAVFDEFTMTFTAPTSATAGETKIAGFAITDSLGNTVTLPDIELSQTDTANDVAKKVATAVNAKLGETGLYAEANATSGVVTFTSVRESLDADGDFKGYGIETGTGTNLSAPTDQTAATTAPTTGNGGLKYGDDLDITSVVGAQQAMAIIDKSLGTINGARAELGAVQNRFTSVINNLQTTSENMSSARGRIVDADFAAETANLTRGQILQQAGTAMLAQANGLPQNVLSLLRG
jgi:flagellin